MGGQQGVSKAGQSVYEKVELKCKKRYLKLTDETTKPFSQPLFSTGESANSSPSELKDKNEVPKKKKRKIVSAKKKGKRQRKLKNILFITLGDSFLDKFPSISH